MIGVRKVKSGLSHVDSCAEFGSHRRSDSGARRVFEVSGERSKIAKVAIGRLALLCGAWGVLLFFPAAVGGVR
jgi:hypothetical protein